MAAGRWENDAMATAAGISLAFSAEADPINPHNCVFEEPTEAEQEAESARGFAMLASYLKSFSN
jgi:hypothetical protein